MSGVDDFSELRKEYISHLERENETLRKEVVSVREELSEKDKELKKLHDEINVQQASQGSVNSLNQSLMEVYNRCQGEKPIDPPNTDLTLRHQTPSKYSEDRNGTFTEITICPDCGIVCSRMDNENWTMDGYCKFCGRKGKVQTTLGKWEEEVVETKVVTKKRKWPFGKMIDVEGVEINKVGKWVFKKK